MLFPNYNSAVLAVAVLWLPLAPCQFINTLPQCIRNCINQSQYSNCQVTDIACLCRASAGNFLPDLVTCMHGNCFDIDNNILLAPLQFVCELAGAPIPDSALKNAENQASSLESQVTKTVTIGGSSATVFATVTTTEEGSTHTLVYPITIEKTTTVSGEPSTITATPTKGFTTLIPIVIVSTDSEGSTYTTTTSQSGAISTYTTTDSDGGTVTQKSTFTETASSDDDSSSASFTDSESISTTLTSTTIAGSAVTSTSSDSSSGASSGASSTFTAPPASQTNSAPFTDTNGAGRKVAENWLGLGILLALSCAWF